MKQGDDDRWMRVAIDLSRRGLGQTWPNPSVGCVLVKDNKLLAQGWTQPGGRPHAESFALAQAGQSGIEISGSTAYVTLEPCAHHGKTPPCADALIAAGIARVVVGIEDPDPRVAGRGIDNLRRHGIDVVSGVCSDDIRHILAGYLMRCHTGRPLFALKIASSLDGRIALANGQSKWITAPAARSFGHMLRARHDAILVGMGTVRQDNPLLNCRLPGLEDRNPRIIVIDPGYTISLDSNVIKSLIKPIIIGSTSIANKEKIIRRASLMEAGCHVLDIDMNMNDQTIDINKLSSEIGRIGLTSVLIEGGAMTSRHFLSVDYVDHLWWFSGNMILGGDAVAAVAPLGLDVLDRARHWIPVSDRVIAGTRIQLLSRGND